MLAFSRQVLCKILKKVNSRCKTVDELVKDIVSEKLEEDKNLDTLPFALSKLDYRKYIKIIDEPLEE